MRFLLTIGGAGAQKEIFAEIIRFLLPQIKEKKAALYVNVGDFLRLVGGIIDFVVHKNSNILMPDADHISTFSAYLALFSMY